MHPLKVLLLMAAVASLAALSYVLANGIDDIYRLDVGGSAVSLDGRAVVTISIMIILGAIASFALGGQRRP